MDLEQLLKLALENNPKINIAVQQYGQAEGQLVQANSAYLPRISVGASGGRYHIDQLQPVEEDSVVQAGISASQLIFDFGKTLGAMAAGRFKRDAARANLDQQVHDLIFDVKTAYYSVLEKEALVQVALQAISNYEQHLYRARKFFDAGVRTRIDITNAELELANARLNHLQAASNLATARVRLEQVIGIQPENGQYQLAAGVPLNNLATTLPSFNEGLNQLLETAHKLRPGLAQLSALMEAARASLDSAQGDNWPTFTATGSMDTYETDISSLYDQWQITAGLSWEIFSGFETQGKIAEARASLLELENSRRELELSIIRDVTDAHLRAKENREGVSIANLAMNLAQKNLELAEGRYRAGLGDMLEFNDAQLNLTQSQSNLVTTYYAYLTALARRDRAAGINNDIPVESIDRLLEP